MIAGSILVAIDGTGSEAFSTSPDYYITAADGTVRTQSSVRNFYDDYYGIRKAYRHGPAGWVFVAGEMEAIHNGVMSWLTMAWLENRNRPIDMVGHSRGGYVAMEVARDLLTEGLAGFGPVSVRFLGLYDPVDMALGYGDAETISANVEMAALIFAAGTSEEVGIAGKYEYLDDGTPIPVELRSRAEFNRADHGPESPSIDYDQIWIFGTHSAIGGAPWKGDHPVGHSESNDRAKAIESDQFIRSKALSTNVPINLVDDYGFDSLGPPEN